MPQSYSDISEQPRLRPGDLWKPPIEDGLFNRFYGRQAVLFYFGRGALWCAVNSMNLSSTDNILVPAYHCGVEIEAIRMAGAQLRYYDIKSDLTVDIQELQANIDSNTKAILLIHYFGFPQPVEVVRTICRKNNICLIEDCCHALFSSTHGQPLGTFGEMAIYSQRKTLPLPDGGALLINSNKRLDITFLARPSYSVAAKKALGMLFRSLFGAKPDGSLPFPFEQVATVINRRITKTVGIRYSTGMAIDLDRCLLGMSTISRYIMEHTDIATVIRRRRANYLHLLSMLQAAPGIRIIHHKLPEGVCPLFMPVIVEGQKRGWLQDRLLQSGIHAFIFGGVLHPSLADHPAQNAELFSHHLLCLPVHQGLTTEDMTFIGECMLRAVKE